MSIPHTPNPISDPIGEAVEFLRARVKPLAQEIDQDSAALGEALRKMADRGLLGLRVPTEYGGVGLSEIDFRRFQEACARTSGCLAFLQTQHQSACAMLAKSENDTLRAEYLPQFASGESLCGIAFSQLRRKTDKPVLAATIANGGFVLNGDAPWVTGIGFFDYCVTAATAEDGDTIFVLHPLAEVGGLSLSAPMRLASMEPAQTVSANFVDYFVAEGALLYVRAGNWIENNDMINIALQSPFALGCAQAGLDVVAENYSRKNIAAIGETLSSLSAELEECRVEAYAAMDDRTDSERSLSARGWAIDLALRCAAAAVVTSSGAGNSLNHSAQRVYREALVFAVSAQTAAIMEATLRRIAP